MFHLDTRIHFEKATAAVAIQSFKRTHIVVPQLCTDFRPAFGLLAQCGCIDAGRWASSISFLVATLNRGTRVNKVHGITMLIRQNLKLDVGVAESIAPNTPHCCRMLPRRRLWFPASKQVPARPSALPPAYPCHPRRRMVSPPAENQWPQPLRRCRIANEVTTGEDWHASFGHHAASVHFVAHTLQPNRIGTNKG